jgi:uncharacterized protein YcbK (DUF882 family)
VNRPTDSRPETGLTRRGVLHAGAAALLALALGPARARAEVRGPRRLRMLSTHTGERADVVYHDGLALVPGALVEASRLLRDHRTGDVHPIDPGVLDIAWSLAEAAQRPLAEFEIVSGFRSPRTNAQLRSASEHSGVASRSLHLEGRAIDLRLPGLSTPRLAELAVDLQRGGVGFYAASDFVHLDTGRIRTW